MKKLNRVDSRDFIRFKNIQLDYLWLKSATHPIIHNPQTQPPKKYFQFF